ncbi:hypothetical protein K1719_009525 [Acacia pycnantha]|nr:hypothetical protein K1719_009525 [Acacia pycnantha]
MNAETESRERNPARLNRRGKIAEAGVPPQIVILEKGKTGSWRKAEKKEERRNPEESEAKTRSRREGNGDLVEWHLLLHRRQDAGRGWCFFDNPVVRMIMKLRGGTVITEWWHRDGRRGLTTTQVEGFMDAHTTTRMGGANSLLGMIMNSVLELCNVNWIVELCNVN